MKKAIDVNDLEAQFLANNNNKKSGPAFIIGDEEDEEDIVQLNDDFEEEEETVVIPVKKGHGEFSYAAATGNKDTIVNNSTGTPQRQSATLTVEELEAQLLSGMVVSPKSPVSQLVGAGPPPGMMSSSNPVNTVSNVASSSIVAGFTVSGNNSNVLSSTAPLPKNDPNREFMNRFERNLIMKIHTTQLTTETPLMDDFYYQALTKKKATMAEGTGPLLYFPLPSAAERQKELQRRERRKKQREKEREKEREKQGFGSSSDNLNAPLSTSAPVEINAELVLGKVSHSTSRKPRQQLQIPTKTVDNQSSPMSLHEKVLKGIESVYNSIITVEDYYLLQEEYENRGDNSNPVPNGILPDLKELIKEANQVFKRELNLTGSEAPNHEFIHFLTIPKGKSVISKVLRLLEEEGKEQFLSNLIEYFDFLEIVRPETSLNLIDAFISQVLSPLVTFVGEAEWKTVLNGLNGLFSKRSFVWIALTKSGMVLLCILLSRLEILKSTTNEESLFLDESAILTEKMFDSLEGHLLEFFSLKDPSRDFYAWQCLALLAMNVESDRKRSMILELRDKILVVVETGEERQVKNLNVFLNALGLDASQLK